MVYPYPLAQIRALCEAHPLQRKLLFVPSPQIGYNLTTALAREGRPWVNLMAVTPARYAKDLVGQQLRVDGWGPLPRDSERFHVDELLRRSFSEGAAEYFSGMDRVEGLAPTFQRTLHALRIAGVTPEELADGALDAGKSTALARVLQHYERWLAEQHYYDDAALFEAALEHLTEVPESPPEPIYAVLDATPLPGYAGRFVRRLAGDRLYRIGRPGYGTPPPMQSAASRCVTASFPETSDAHVGAGGEVLRAGIAPERSTTVTVREALGAETEIRGVFRDVVDSGIALDQVEVVYTTEAPYLPLLVAAAERYDLQVAFAEGIPVTLTTPGQALASYYRWIQKGFDAGELAAMCRARLVTFARVVAPEARVEPYRVASLVRRARARKGRAQCLAALDRLYEELSAANRDRDETPDDVAQLPSARGVLETLFAQTPSGTTSVEALATAGIRFLEDFAAVRTGRDTKARESLADRLAQLGSTVERTAPASWIAEQLAELVSTHHVEASVAEPGHLYVVPLERSGYSGRRHVYVVGMDEGSFPGTVTEDPLLLDDERARLSKHVTLQRSRPAERVWHLVRLLSMAPGPVTLVANRQDLADGRERYPSALFQQVAAQCALEPERFEITPAVDDALDETEVWLALRGASGGTSHLASLFPALARGRRAAEKRAQDALTRFDGWLGEATPHLAPGPNGRVFSASRLETLARCPYRYFLKYVLEIVPPEETEPDPSRWLDPRAFGALLHRLFHTFMKRLAARGEQPDEAQHADLLEALLEELIEAFVDHIPPPTEAAFRADVRRLRRAARVFLTAESRRDGVQPVGFEVSFGYGRSDGLHHPDPITVRLSDDVDLPLRGRIDRVDRTDQGYAIWDYKTGSAGPYDERDLLSNTTHLQWVLYAYALERILAENGRPSTVHRSGYYFANDREHGRRIGQAPPPREELARRLRPLIELAESGRFYHVQKTKQCRYCDYNRICAEEKRLPKHVDAICAAMPPDAHPHVALLEQWLQS